MVGACDVRSVDLHLAGAAWSEDVVEREASSVGEDLRHPHLRVRREIRLVDEQVERQAKAGLKVSRRLAELRGYVRIGRRDERRGTGRRLRLGRRHLDAGAARRRVPGPGVARLDLLVEVVAEDVRGLVGAGHARVGRVAVLSLIPTRSSHAVVAASPMERRKRRRMPRSLHGARGPRFRADTVV